MTYTIYSPWHSAEFRTWTAALLTYMGLRRTWEPRRERALFGIHSDNYDDECDGLTDEEREELEQCLS